jgi:hypothetical protein
LRRASGVLLVGSERDACRRVHLRLHAIHADGEASPPVAEALTVSGRCSSAVERTLGKGEVRGSNPLSGFVCDASVSGDFGVCSAALSSSLNDEQRSPSTPNPFGVPFSVSVSPTF